MDLELKGKWALVTGSNRGTGEIIARQLADEGARVIVHSLKEGDSVTVAQSLSGASAVWGDITGETGADQVVSQVNHCCSRLDILVNNYGIASSGRWLTSATDKWVDAYQHNALSVVRLVQAFVPAMKAGGVGARIVNLGTVGAVKPGAKMPHYYAAKGALATMTVSLAKELTGTDITVNTVAPGVIRTAEVEASFRQRAQREGWDGEWPDIERRIVAEQFPNPMQRMASREEVADLVLFLCSARASYINGQNICIDGGMVDRV
ncbi:MAG: SDR family oxidoreductase [Halieaceae bacterium]|jgi:3-oxoacyl-[acyl-carrier protein] reductase|nr:SDR family oxidoreductase [Halieaceae bacterium]